MSCVGSDASFYSHTQISCLIMFANFVFARTFGASCLRCLALLFFRRRCLAPFVRWITFPVFVILNRFAAIFRVFNFGIRLMFLISRHHGGDHSPLHARLSNNFNILKLSYKLIDNAKSKFSFCHFSSFKEQGNFYLISFF